MLTDFIIGSLVSVCVMICHLFSTLVIQQSLTAISARMRTHNIIFLTLSLSIFYILAFLTLCMSVSIWAIVYFKLGFTQTYMEAFYTAMINYTTLGLGDLSPAIKTSMYGPMAAASGILMFSWSAALLVYIVQMHLPIIKAVEHKKKP